MKTRELALKYVLSYADISFAGEHILPYLHNS